MKATLLRDRLLQLTDFCERHFESRFANESWKAAYKGYVLVSAPQKAALAKDAVPTKFPGYPCNLTKNKKKSENNPQTASVQLPANSTVSQSARGIVTW